MTPARIAKQTQKSRRDRWLSALRAKCRASGTAVARASENSMGCAAAASIRSIPLRDGAADLGVDDEPGQPGERVVVELDGELQRADDALERGEHDEALEQLLDLQRPW